jgi:hypothetical protein
VPVLSISSGPAPISENTHQVERPARDTRRLECGEVAAAVFCGGTSNPLDIPAPIDRLSITFGRAGDDAMPMTQQYRGAGEVYVPGNATPVGRCECNLTRDVIAGPAGDFGGTIRAIPPLTLQTLYDLSTKASKTSEQLKLKLDDGRWVNFIVITPEGAIRISGDAREER